jgi:predicted ester cyclase
MINLTEQNKSTVIRFNREFIEQGNLDVIDELVSDEFHNHTAVAGVPRGKEGMIFFLQNVLRKAFPDLVVEIFEMVAEHDLVTTRKKITGTHTGEIAGMTATGKKVVINIIDMVRLKNGMYVEHWGMSNMTEVLAALGSNS